MDKEKCKLLEIDDKDIYLKLSNEYKKYFEKFLLSKINLLKYDEEIKNSELGFGDISGNLILKSNLNEYMNLNHIFILNEFHIEKLNKEQIEILKRGDEFKKNILIEETYKEIIKNNYYNGCYSNKVYKINYLNSNGNNGFFDNDSLVIAVYYGKNKNKYGNKEKYLDNYLEKKYFLNKLINEIKEVIKKELDLKCEIIFNKI